MFWWEKAADADWGKIKLAWPGKWLTTDGSNNLVTADDEASAQDFFYQMRDSTLQTRKNGHTYEVTTAGPKKWT